MGQINIVITIDAERLLYDLPDGGEITHPRNYLAMQDDQVFDHGPVTELTTYVEPGDMLVWTIKSLLGKHPVQFNGIQTRAHIFIESPQLFYASRKCAGVIKKGITENTPLNYTIEFYLDNDITKTWYWDPFIEARGEESAQS